MKIAYKSLITKQDDGKYLVTFQDLEEAITEGVSFEEALFNAEEVLTLTLEGRMDENMDIPEPTTETSDPFVLVYPSPRIQAALLVRFSRENKSMAEIARSLETSWPAAARMEDPHHWSSLRQLSKLANILGTRLILSFEDPIKQTSNRLN